MVGHKVRFAALTCAAIVVFSSLAGCAETAAPLPDNTAPTVEPTTEPTVAPPADTTEDILFLITANVRAADGRTIGISLAAHAPLASTDEGAADARNALVDVCGSGTGVQPIDEQYLSDNGSTLMRIAITATTPDLKFQSPIELLLGSPYFAQAAIGPGVTPVSDGITCFSGFEWSKSGKVLGVSDFENADGVPDLEQWKTGMYGFFVKPNSGATIEACKVTITELGMKTNIVNVQGWDPSNAGDGVSCKIGYSGD